MLVCPEFSSLKYMRKLDFYLSSFSFPEDETFTIFTCWTRNQKLHVTFRYYKYLFSFSLVSVTHSYLSWIENLFVCQNIITMFAWAPPAHTMLCANLEAVSPPSKWEQKVLPLADLASRPRGASSWAPAFGGRRRACSAAQRARAEGRLDQGCSQRVPAPGRPDLQACVLVCAQSGVSDSTRAPGPQPPRLLCLWGLSGKNTGVGCHRGVSIGAKNVPGR